MDYRTLGRSPLRVSAIGLGCMSMSGTYGKGDDAQSMAVVHRALDLGVNFLDSSDMYGWGHNEELLGRALKGRREGVVLTTKFELADYQRARFIYTKPDLLVPAGTPPLEKP